MTSPPMSAGIVLDAYRKSHEIDGSTGGAQTDYQKQIRVFRSDGADIDEGVFVGTKCRADFGDIRFRQGVTELDNWLEETASSAFLDITDLDFRAVTVDSEGTVWAGAGADDKLYKSIDGGVSWTEIYTVPGNPDNIRVVFVDSNGYIFISGNDPDLGTSALHRSVDGGSSFASSLALDDHCCIWRMAEDTSGNLIAAVRSKGVTGQAKLYRSINGGVDWTLEWDDADGFHMHGVFYDPYQDYFYAINEGAAGHPERHGLLRSTDGGDTWTLFKSGADYFMTAFLATPAYRFWGRDIYDKIIRTANDEDFDTVWAGSSDEWDVIWGTRIGDKLYWSMITNDRAVPDRSPYLLKTDLDGTNGVVIKTWTKSPPWYGSTYCSHEGGLVPNGDALYLHNNVTDERKYIVASNALFWVTVPTIPADPGSTEIHVYYGKADATTTSDIKTTFPILGEDFEDGVVGVIPAGWTKTQGDVGDTLLVADDQVKHGSKSVKHHESGVATDSFFDTDDLNGYEYLALHFWVRYEDANARAKVTVMSELGAPCLTFLYRDTHNDWRSDELGGFVTIPNWTGPSPDTWYDIEIRMRTSDNKARYIKDGVEDSGWRDMEDVWDTIDYMRLAGVFGFPTDVWYDDIFMRNWVDPEPAHGDWGAEEAVVWPF